jgi:hypothetical protein
MTFVAGARDTPIEAISRGVLKKERHIFIQGWLITLNHQEIVPSCGNDLLTKMVLCKESIGTDDAPVKQNRGEKEVHMGQFPRLLLNSGFFEHNACFGFIHIQMMHFPLIWGQMLLCSFQRLAIEHDMLLFCGFALLCPHPRSQIHENLIDVSRVNSP